ncbi:MAG: hypothetical protein BWX85_00824 [Chloroflexi bacterium ADurb.Bin120]|nr:MAG: hypothetical protein BWX85_00824 [Chloroflexi bacterium ADurb.Bin120]
MTACYTNSHIRIQGIADQIQTVAHLFCSRQAQVFQFMHVHLVAIQPNQIGICRPHVYSDKFRFHHLLLVNHQPG